MTILVDRLVYEGHSAFIRVDEEASSGRAFATMWTSIPTIGNGTDVSAPLTGLASGLTRIEWAYARRDAWFQEVEPLLVLADRAAAISARSIPRLERLGPLVSDATLDEVVAALVHWSTPNLTAETSRRLVIDDDEGTRETDEAYRTRVAALRQFRITR